MPEITHLFFDCDNTLVLSEALAFKACAKLANEACAAHGIKSSYTGDELIRLYVGQNFRSMMTDIKAKTGLQLTDKELDDYVSREVDEVIKVIKVEGEECPGSTVVLEKLYQEYPGKMSVVSSSAGPRVEASVIKVNQARFFDNRIYSAATSLEKPTSKPNPAIYLHAMKKEHASPQHTLTVEDSRSGASAGVNSKMWVIAYVGAYPEDEREEMAKMLMEEVKCHQLMYHWNEFDQCLNRIRKMDPRPEKDLEPYIPPPKN